MTIGNPCGGEYYFQNQYLLIEKENSLILHENLIQSWNPFAIIDIENDHNHEVIDASGWLVQYRFF